MTPITATSKYMSIRQHLMTRVQQLAPGDRLPSEAVLCEEYGASRITIRHAVDGLIADGRLVREHGRGTFVVEPRFPINFQEQATGEIGGFHALQNDEGNVVTTLVLGQRITHAGETVAARLQINSADKVVEITRLRFVNDVLHHLVVTCLPYERFPDTAGADFGTGSLYDYLRTTHHLQIPTSAVRVGLNAADAALADALDVPEGQTLLRFESTVSDAAGVPVAYNNTHFTPQNSALTFGLVG